MTAYPELRPCARCLRITRPKSRHASEYPFETFSRGDADHCQPCRLVVKGITKSSSCPAIGRADTRRRNSGSPDPQTLRGLNSYLLARRQRLALGGVAQ